MKILSIGNSFSQDAHRYLHRLALHNGVNIKTANLYIGGCSLRTHYLNMLGDNEAYTFEFNGDSTGLKTSIRRALISDDWDFVTFQQASPLSVRYETYTPYIEALSEYVKKYCPHAKILIHQTWAYEEGSARLETLGLGSAEEMLDGARAAYAKASEAAGAYATIPSGEAMMYAVRCGVGKIHRDTFHASLGVGRYLLALLWYRVLTGNDISHDSFDDLDEPVGERERAIVISAVNTATA